MFAQAMRDGSMAVSYSPALVTLSVVVAILASYTALDLAGTVAAATSNRARQAWLAGSSVAMGVGIWSMHFIGMLAFRLPVAVAYDLRLVVLSVAVAIAASLLALVTASREHVSLRVLVIAGACMGPAIAGMHYIGMAALRAPGERHYSAGIVALSIVIAVTASIVALWLAHRFRRAATLREHAGKAVSAMVMGFAIAGMHYTGMAAAHFVHVPGSPPIAISSLAVVPTPMLATTVTLATLFVLGLALLGSVVASTVAGNRSGDRSSRDLLRTLRRTERIVVGVGLVVIAIVAHAVATRDRSSTLLDPLRQTIQDPPSIAALRRLSQVAAERDRLALTRDAGVVVSLLGLFGAVMIVATAMRRTIRQHSTGLEQLASIVRSSDDAMMYCTLDGVVVSWNAGAERMFGYSAAEVIGRSVGLVADAAGRNEQSALFEQLRFGKRLNGFETTRLHKDGHRIDVALTGSVILSASGRPLGVSMIARDIGERKRFDAEQRAGKEAAEAANRAKSEFLANMSHEIRTPMNGIIGMTELALDTELTQDQREYLNMVRSSADSLLTVINDILDFSKIEARKLDLEIIDFDLSVMLDDTIRAQAYRAHQKGIEIAYRVAPDVPTLLRGDPARVRQVLLNLVGNAVKFTDTGEVIVDVTRAASDDQSVHLQFSVCDTGIGIPADKHAAIFESFTQADNSTTRKFGGTGLGLTIAKQLVGLMGGRIWVESRPGAGSTFSFTVQFVARPEAAPELPARTLADIRGMRVLVVDDNAMNRRLLREILTQWHMEPVLVDRGQAALVAMVGAHREGNPFPLVLLDFQMPDMDGFQVAAAIQEHAELTGSTVMMLSSVGQRGDAARCRELGIAAYLTKPIKQSILLDAIHTALSGQRSDRGQARPLVTQHSLRESHRVLRVLLAEDNPINRALIIQLLKKRGHAVVVAENGRQAIEAHERETFDVVLMDVQMPDVDGFEATIEIRRREATSGKHVPIIALTAHAMTGDRERCLAAGMDYYLTKPVRPAELYETIQKAAPNPRASKELTLDEVARAAAPPNGTPAPTLAFNPVEAMAMVADDRELLGQMVELFCAERPRMLSAIKSSVTAGDAAGLARTAHALKGSVGNFGTSESFESARELERMGREGVLVGAGERCATLESQLGRLEHDLSDFVADDATPAGAATP